MNGAPHPDYLAQINATLGGGPPPAGPVMLGQRPMGGAPGPMPPPPPEPVMPPPPPGLIGPPNDPRPGPMAGGLVPHAPTAAPSPAAAPPPPPSPFLQRVNGGIVNTPARETEMRGPSLRAAQGERNVAMEGAIKAVTERSEHTAAADYALALDEARKAGVREDAANHVAADRATEMAERQADFDQSAKALGQAGQIDPGRFWSNAGVGQKVLALISVALGGFVSQQNGGRNVGMDVVNSLIANDIKAQEFAYNASRDTVNAKQTAFSMAMQKYNNADQARAAARAASLDVAAAHVAAQGAMWKGTEAANRAQMAMAALQDDRAQQIAAGVAYAPARQVAVGASYIDPRTGLRYSEQEAKGLVGKMDEREFAREQKGTDVAGQIMVEGAKAGQKANEKADEGAKFISSQLQQAGVPQARAAAERALAALNASEGGAGEGAVRGALGSGLSKKVLSEEANAREQAYAVYTNTAIKATMGNATADEVARATAGLGSISDPAGRRRAIQATMKELDEIEKNARAGTTSAAQQDFSQKRKSAEGGPPVAPKGSKAGW